jgi:hypothetical protein
MSIHRDMSGKKESDENNPQVKINQSTISKLYTVVMNATSRKTYIPVGKIGYRLRVHYDFIGGDTFLFVVGHLIVIFIEYLF